MSYTAVPQNPPAYDSPEPRADGDNIPDDFKYGTYVSECSFDLRQMFVRKVYSLLSLQVLATILVGAFMRYNTSVRDWALTHSWPMWVSILGAVGFMIGAFFKSRSYPINLVLLGGFTLCESYGIGMVAATLESEILFQALLLTAVVFIGLTLFAFQTKYDFTSWQGAASIGLWVLIGWGFMFMFFPQHSSTVELVYSGLGALVFAVYVVIDTQNIMRNYHLEDEVPACIALYLDLLNLFLYIVRLLSSRNDN